MTRTDQEHSVLAIYDSHEGVKVALEALRHEGFDIEGISIIGKDFHAGEQALGNLLEGGAFFVIAAIGPIVVMGPLVSEITTALEGAGVGTSTGVLAAALAKIGIAKDRVSKYELAVRVGKILVLGQGTPALLHHARVILGTTCGSYVEAKDGT